MSRQRKLFIGKTVAILSAIPILLWAHALGPDPGKTGAPGDSTCNEAGCHVGTGLNAGGGAIQISASGGTTYTPGATQQITVTVSDPTARRWGFQLTARSGAGRTRAGVLANTDSSTQILCAAANLLEIIPCPSTPVLQFIEHSDATRNNGTGSFTFKFNWTAPATDAGDITLYAAGNAANGNMLETGDHIYTTSLTLKAGAIPTEPAPTISSIADAENCSPCAGDASKFKAEISPNGFVTIKGTNLATRTREWQGPDFVGNALPTSLDGSSVKINGKPAFPSFISPGQINALAPIDTATGPVSIEVGVNGQTSSSTVTLQTMTPAFILFNFDKYIASRHLDSSLLGPATLFPGSTTPAKPGEIIQMFGTGFGPTTPAVVNGQILSGAPALANAVKITFGGVDVTPSSSVAGTFAGLSATGLYQFNIKVPDAAPNGDNLVVATINGISTQSNTFITVQR